MHDRGGPASQSFHTFLEIGRVEELFMLFVSREESFHASEKQDIFHGLDGAKL